MLKQFTQWITALTILLLFLLLLTTAARGLSLRGAPGPLFTLGVPLAGVSALVWLATHFRRN